MQRKNFKIFQMKIITCKKQKISYTFLRNKFLILLRKIQGTLFQMCFEYDYVIFSF